MTDFRLDLYTLYIFPYLDSSLIESSPINQVVLEGNNLTLRCSASGNPTPDITWTKDKSSLVLHQGDTYSIVDIDRELHMYSLEWSGRTKKSHCCSICTL